MYIVAHERALELSSLYQAWMQLDRNTSDKQVMEFHHKLKNMASEEGDWNSFLHHFNELHPGFFEKLDNRFPNLSPESKRMCGYIRMRLNNKEIGSLMKVIPASVKRAQIRLKKKIGLDDKYFVERVYIKTIT